MISAYVVSQITGFDLGLCTTVILTALVGAQALVLRRKFKPILFLQVLGSSIFGMFVSLASKLFVYLPPAQNYVVQLVYCALGIGFIAVGVLLYLSYNIVSLPVEGLAQAMSTTYHKEFSNMKMCVDWSMVLVAVAVSWLGAGEIIGVREGTLLVAFGVGMVMKPMQKLMKLRKTK